jgi:hypothetical protein
LHQDAVNRAESQNQLTPELTPHTEIGFSGLGTTWRFHTN